MLQETASTPETVAIIRSKDEIMEEGRFPKPKKAGQKLMKFPDAPTLSSIKDERTAKIITCMLKTIAGCAIKGER